MAYTVNYRILAMLRLADFVRRGDRWYFGTKLISAATVERLLRTGKAELAGDRLRLATKEVA